MNCPWCQNDIPRYASKCPLCTGNIEYGGYHDGSDEDKRGTAIVTLIFGAIGGIGLPLLAAFGKLSAFGEFGFFGYIGLIVFGFLAGCIFPLMAATPSQGS